VEGDFELSAFKSNSFSMEWPPRSGRMQDFPEVDAAAWLAPEDAILKISKGQIPILRALYARLGEN
jgi:predicted NUDIX family NTP pyrophosphohydrolase